MADDTVFQPGSFNSQEVINRGWGSVNYGSDANKVVEFYNKAVHNKARSAEEGRPVYDEVIFTKVYTPGEQRYSIVDRPTQPGDKQRWPGQWNQFVQNRQQIPEGTPIDLLYPDHPAVAQTLRGHGVHTIEQCAKLSGIAIEDIGMGSQRYVNDAAKYLEMANKGMAATQVRRELEDRDRKIASLERQLKEQAQIIDGMQRNSAGNADLAAIQNLLASVMQRPTHAPQANYDAQSTMIAANSPQTLAAKGRRKRATLA